MTPRAYRSTVRERAAAATRAAVLDAAEVLFADHGYAHVTIRQIADGAGVAPGTVYATFGTKSALVTGLTERAAGDVSIGDVLAAVAHATTGHEVVRLVVRNTYELVRRHHRAMMVLFDAATVDQDIAAVLRVTEELQRERLGQVAGRLESLGALRPGTTVSDAVRILEYFVAPLSWNRLLQLGWEWEDAHTFLTDTVASALLSESVS